MTDTDITALIEQLRDDTLGTSWRLQLQAADALVALQAERDAAVTAIRALAAGDRAGPIEQGHEAQFQNSLLKPRDAEKADAVLKEQ